jgi:hypothetical protein
MRIEYLRQVHLHQELANHQRIAQKHRNLRSRIIKKWIVKETEFLRPIFAQKIPSQAIVNLFLLPTVLAIEKTRKEYLYRINPIGQLFPVQQQLVQFPIFLGTSLRKYEIVDFVKKQHIAPDVQVQL